MYLWNAGLHYTALGYTLRRPLRFRFNCNTF